MLGSIIPLATACASDTIELTAEKKPLDAPASGGAPEETATSTTPTPEATASSQAPEPVETEQSQPAEPPESAPAAPEPTQPPVSVNPVGKPHPWEGIQYRLAGEGQYVAWTVDDGADSDTVRAYAEFAAKTGTRLTFFINASYPSFEENKDLLLPLVQSGQIQIANHTYNHPNLLKLSDKRVLRELERNEEEIMRLFGVSSKPYFRPPYAFYDDRVLKIAAKAGFSRVVLWEGTTGDEEPTTQRVILKRTHKYMLPQRIVLGHLNYNTIVGLLERIKAMLDERGLVTVTLRDYYGEVTEEELKASRESDPSASLNPEPGKEQYSPKDEEPKLTPGAAPSGGLEG